MNTGKEQTIHFIDKIEELKDIINNDLYVEESLTLKKYLTQIILEAKELIKVNEWMIALENTLTNLDEVNFKLPKYVLEPIINILYNYDRTSYISFVKEMCLDKES